MKFAADSDLVSSFLDYWGLKFKTQVGLASVAAAVQRGGGSKEHPSEALNEDLELLAASIEAAALPEVHILGMTFMYHSKFCHMRGQSTDI